ncbi:MAG: transcription elongation factor GreB [Burkholderiaceae bacterium]
MNKAFVRESDGEDDDDEAPESATPLPQGFRNYMTPAGQQALRDEFLDLLNRQRPEIVSIVSWAASNGDRSENGDYIYGKKRLREIDRRLRFLTRRLETAVLVDPALQEQRDRVFFGATVRYLRNGEHEETVTIVGVDETDTRQGRVSWIAPVSRALLKATEGDEVVLRTPLGDDTLEVLEISYPDEPG